MPVLSTDAHASPRGAPRLQAIPFLLSTLAGISVARVPLPDNLRPGAARARALAAAYRAVSAFEEREAPPLDLSQVLSCVLLLLVARASPPPRTNQTRIASRCSVKCRVSPVVCVNRAAPVRASARVARTHGARQAHDGPRRALLLRTGCTCRGSKRACAGKRRGSARAARAAQAAVSVPPFPVPPAVSVPLRLCKVVE